MDKVKIQEIADESGLSNSDLLDKSKELGFNVTTANSTISMEDAGVLIDYAISGTLPKGFIEPERKVKTASSEKDITAIEDIIIEDFWDAIYTNNIRMVKKFLSLLGDVDFEDDNGMTPLYWASIKNYIDIVKLLIDHKVDVNFEGINSTSALIEASKHGHIDIVKLLIANGANINIKASVSMTPLHYAADIGYIDIAEFLIKKGVDVNIEDGDGMTSLHYATNTSIIDMVSFLIEKGADLNYKSRNGEVALKYPYDKNDEEIVKLLLNNGADEKTIYREGKTFVEHARYTNKKWFLDLVSKLHDLHNPKRLVELLTNFRKDTPIKYTTHIWDMNFKDDYGEFNMYLSKVKEQWNGIKNELKILSPRLHSKIYTFLLNEDTNSKSWCSKNGDDINIGWSSLKGLKKWCNDGKDPFDFKLEESYKIENRTISTFGEIINLFKQEIQIRNENSMLENIFIDIEEKIDDKYDGIFEFELINLKGKSFYIDTEIFKDILNERIFKDVTKIDRHKYGKIKVEMKPNTASNHHELRIIQIGSQSGQSSYDMLNHHGADTSIIKEGLKNLCDWSIESSSEDENYRINYLKSESIDDIEPLDYKPEGYTHIMRFYK